MKDVFKKANARFNALPGWVKKGSLSVIAAASFIPTAKHLDFEGTIDGWAERYRMWRTEQAFIKVFQDDYAKNPWKKYEPPANKNQNDQKKSGWGMQNGG